MSLLRPAVVATRIVGLQCRQKSCGPSSSRSLRLDSATRPVTRLAIPCVARRYISSGRRSTAEVTNSPPLSQTNKAEFGLRRFWKSVNVQQNDDGDYMVNLDHRNLKTPSGTKLVIPQRMRLLALLIANEWENQNEVLKQHSLPVTSLASRAIDGLGDLDTRHGVIEALMAYTDTDTICFQEETPRALVRMQKEHWDPLFSWMKREFGIDLVLADGFAPARQTQATKDKLRGILEEMDHWELAAFERAVYASKSFIIALALCRGQINAEQAAQASHVEVRSQIEIWGEVEDTHDVDYQDIRRAMGSVSCLLVKT